MRTSQKTKKRPKIDRSAKRYYAIEFERRPDRPARAKTSNCRDLEKEPAQKQKAQQKNHGIDHDFDKTHILFTQNRKILPMQVNHHFRTYLTQLSKLLSSNALLWLPWLVILFVTTAGFGQDIVATISLDNVGNSRIRISGRFSDEIAARGVKNLSFLNNYGASTGLGERVSSITLTDRAGSAVGSKRFAAGEYVADSNFSHWEYVVDAPRPADPASAAHISWITDDLCLLMLDDILPQASIGGRSSSGRVEFKLPAGWHAYSADKGFGDGIFETADVEKAVFYLEKSVSERQSGDLLIHGRFNFTSDEANEMAAEIVAGYTKLIGPLPDPRFQITFIRTPPGVPPGIWEADTRGRSVTIISSDMPFKTQSLQRLHEQFRHELFHLWIPNALNLSGNYDWFYEGFALYTSLKSGVLGGRIRLEDMLDTLSRAYNIDALQPSGISLLQASKQRWNGGNTRVYARGMIVAFLCDLTLLENSKGKISVDEVVREVYTKHLKPAVSKDGNESIIAVLSSHPELDQIVINYVTGGKKIAWAPELSAAGIEPSGAGAALALKLTEHPNGRQKKILDRLGYNSWRSAPRSSK